MGDKNIEVIKSYWSGWGGVIGQAEKGEGFHLPSAYFLVLEIPSSPRSVDRVKLVMYVYKRH